MARKDWDETGFAHRFESIIDEQPDKANVAKKMGVTVTALDHYARGRRKPDLAKIARLRALTGVNLNWLLTGIRDPAPSVVLEGEEFRTLGVGLQAGAGEPQINKDDREAQRLAFRADWLRKECGTADVDEKCAFLVRVKGTSMQPIIRDGAIVLARRWCPPPREEFLANPDKHLSPKKVYVVRQDIGTESALIVKRVRYDKKTRILIISSDNPHWGNEPYLLHIDDQPIQRIVKGEVFWVSQLIG